MDGYGNVWSNLAKYSQEWLHDPICLWKRDGMVEQSNTRSDDTI